MRSSNALAGSSLGSCGISSPRKALTSVPGVSFSTCCSKRAKFVWGSLTITLIDSLNRQKLTHKRGYYDIPKGLIDLNLVISSVQDVSLFEYSCSILGIGSSRATVSIRRPRYLPSRNKAATQDCECSAAISSRQQELLLFQL